MPKKSPHPHVAWRDGRPRFQPDQNLRAKGHKGKDLRHPDGRWFSRGEAVDWSAAFVESLKEAPAPKPKRKPGGRPAAVQLYTVERLFDEWWKSSKFQLPEDPHELRRKRAAKIIYAPKSIVDFKQKARVIERHDPSLWAAPVDALTTPVLFGLYEELVSECGLATARGALAVFSIALSWGRRRGKTTFRMNQGVNPAKGLGMATPPPRVRFASRVEISTLIAVADHLGWPEMGDMIALGVWTGQRQADRLMLVDKGLMNGRRIFRQGKTNVIVAIREAPELEARLAASRARRQAAGIVNPRVILDEQVWQPFPDDGDRYRKRFAELRAIAAAGIIDEEATAAEAARWQAEGRSLPPPVIYRIKPCGTLLGDDETGLQPFFEADLRDTSVTWQALAGATIPEIVSITGHTLESATRILKHYLARHPEMADSAIQKMVDWYEADGETEFGL